MADALLEVRGLTKRFGGLVASDGIALRVAEGETLAIIGPNGAGKTTLIGQLAGDLRPDAGSIRFAGEDVTALGAAARSHRGLARSFQITSIFRDFTALDNVALAVQAHAGHSFRFWRPARREAALREPARAILERVGLGARADVLGGTLAHGEQRQLEIGMALATRPGRSHQRARLRARDRFRRARDDPRRSRSPPRLSGRGRQGVMRATTPDPCPDPVRSGARCW